MTLARRADIPDALPLPEDDVARSLAVLEAAGWTVVRPVTPVRDTWDLVATLPAMPIALLLVAVLRQRPPQLPGVAYGLPAGWSPWTRRLIHCWKADPDLPEALSL